MCRPGGDEYNKRANYSGHKRFQGLTYQTVTVQDGIIINLFGLVEGRKPDSVTYSRSGMEQYLKENLFIEGIQYCIYGDAAYGSEFSPLTHVKWQPEAIACSKSR